MIRINCYSTGASLLLVFQGLIFSLPGDAQESVEWHKQRAFEHAQAHGLDWIQLRDSLHRVQTETGNAPILITCDESLQDAALLMDRKVFRQGDFVSFHLIQKCADCAWSDCVPQLWIDGQWIGSGWAVSLEWSVPTASDLSTIEVRWGETCNKAPAQILVQLKNLCLPPEPSLPPWEIENSGNPWWIGTYFNGEPVTGMAMTRLSPDGLFDRPIVIVEGFDPALSDIVPNYGYGNMNWDALWNCSEITYPNTTSMPFLLDSLIGEGMDLVFLDFMDGTKSVQAQAELLKVLLDKVNEHRLGNHPSVVVGASMGGLIARLALRQRELEGEQDCVHQFITLDSPHEGAYLPLALQEALGFFSLYVANAAELLDVLQSSAAQEMLFITPDGMPVMHGTLMEEMEEIGWPTTPNCLALSNGHPGIAAAWDDGPLIEGWVSSWGINWAHIGLWPLPGNVYHPESTENAHVVFDCSMPNSFGSWWLEPIVSNTAWCNANAHPWEQASASISPHLQALQTGLSEVGFEFTEIQQWSAFVPIESAVNAASNCQSCRLDHRYEPIGSAPASHCDLTGHVDFLLDYILQGQFWPQPGAGDGQAVHHWGALHPEHQWLHGDSLQLGQLWSIGTPLGNGGWGSNWPLFSVRMVPCSSPLVLDSAGVLDVGEWSGQGTGRLIIPDGGMVQLNPGGKLNIGPESELVLESGSTLVLSGGELLLAESAKILAMPGSLVLVEAESTWELPEASETRLDGDVQIQVGQVWRLKGDHSAFLGLSGNIHCVANSEWQVEGLTGDMDILIAGQVSFHGNGLIRWKHVNAHCNPQLHWLMETRAHWKHVNIFADSSIVLQSTNRWRWEHGVALDLNAWHANAQNADPFWRDVEFHHSQLQLQLDDPHISQCLFDATSLVCTHGIGGHLQDNMWQHLSDGIGLGFHEMQAMVYAIGNDFLECETALKLDEADIRLNCNQFIANETGISLLGNSVIEANGEDSGGNWFEGNGHHVHWNGAPWWQIADGNNNFEWASIGAFDGILCCMPTEEPGTHILAAEGNHWATTLDFGTLNLNVQGGVQIQLEPQSTNESPCTTPSAPNDSGEPKRWDIAHFTPCEVPPNGPGILTVYTAQGKFISSFHSHGNQRDIELAMNKLESGLYAVRWTPNDSIDCVWSKLIWNQSCIK